ncbi:unnamed protein product [Brachionus calyciflorus]|uniref:Uncharacterized protein n=1 Tax=Brachionus calyciflorus TaxID=104777 RepID=A0A814J0R3_9BILA|nr:unnamed protein product [Brachionus calyciflorus]
MNKTIQLCIIFFFINSILSDNWLSGIGKFLNLIPEKIKPDPLRCIFYEDQFICDGSSSNLEIDFNIVFKNLNRNEDGYTKKFTISNYLFRKVPQGYKKISDFIPDSISTFEIFNSNLTNLNYYESYKHKSLKNFSFIRCQIDRLDEHYLFSYGVEVFNFTHNRISSIGKYFFFYFKNLIKVDLSNNELKDISILKFNSNFLRLIDLSSSDLKNLDEIYFEKNKTSPEFELNLRNNSLFKIPMITGNLQHIHLFYIGSQNSTKIFSFTGNYTIVNKHKVIDKLVVDCDSFESNEISNEFRSFISSNLWKIIDVNFICKNPGLGEKLSKNLKKNSLNNYSINKTKTTKKITFISNHTSSSTTSSISIESKTHTFTTETTTTTKFTTIIATSTREESISTSTISTSTIQTTTSTIQTTTSTIQTTTSTTKITTSSTKTTTSTTKIKSRSTITKKSTTTSTFLTESTTTSTTTFSFTNRETFPITEDYSEKFHNEENELSLNQSALNIPLLSEEIKNHKIEDSILDFHQNLFNIFYVSLIFYTIINFLLIRSINKNN